MYQSENIESNKDSMKVEPKKCLDKHCTAKVVINGGQRIFSKERVLATTRSQSYREQG